MTVQIIEIAGNRMAVLPENEYRQLLDVAEDREDRDAAIEAEERRSSGEEYVPASVVDALLAGESPLRVWRQYRGLTQTELASRIDVSKMTISGMEKRSRSGSVKVWRALSDALDVSLDDLLPEE
ncbi:MAG TPA: helix-turn-helix transcriptional regulator [Sphingomonas sp.]|nr:helix-turn-helix transcriptional regulator [Sphingomonas sp.]